MKALDGVVACDPAAMRALGYSAIGRYCPMIDADGNELGDYPLTIRELAAYTSAGFPTWLFAELDANAPSDLGGPGGTEYATYALAGLRSLGVPLGAGVYFSNDAVVTDPDNVMAFYAAAARVINPAGYRTGLYGQSTVWSWVKGLGVSLFCHAPDGTEPPWPKGTTIAQSPPPQISINGSSYDVDEILARDFGGFTLRGLWPSVPPAPEEEQDMELLIADDAPEGTSPYWCVFGGNIAELPEGSGLIASLQARGFVLHCEMSAIRALQAAAKVHL